MEPTPRDEVAALIDSTLGGGPRVLHISTGASPVPRRLAQEHDREVECLIWPVDAEDDRDWVRSPAFEAAEDGWAQPFLVAPVDVVVVERVLDGDRDPVAFLRTLAGGALVPGALVVVAGSRDLTAAVEAAGFVLEDATGPGGAEGVGVTVARFPSFTLAQPSSPHADEATAAENRRLAHELERTREQLARERATIARELQLGKDELRAMDKQMAELQDRLQRLRHKNVMLRARVAQVARDRDLATARAEELSRQLALAEDSRAVRVVAKVVRRVRHVRDST
ncbi:hypothetical protein DDE18_09715 [Nocardioides gansuensis]|uniref:Uncharacterized protein n=1 Tax=Nocardioides gansuensis TaxID=2138300 RepID=A0A2T8FAC8_9ACTN|nr:hypothetical protein [Nocardioides gansuensis]PVG82643.1 hypothetical protein DDE18_09715 [Nocardioides gansuensis]